MKSQIILNAMYKYQQMQNRIRDIGCVYKIGLIMLAVFQCMPYQILEGIPVTFAIAGNISYTPTSGGVNIPGYRLQVGFNKYSWIGVKFMGKTSRSTYDIVVVQRSSAPVGGYYKTTTGDYFVSSGRPDKLLSDSVNNMDKSVETYSDSNYFYVELYRTKGNTQGEDWEGGDFVQICFLTSSAKFDQAKWTGLKESCYGYDVSADYVSTFRGKQIGTMSVDGANSLVYGGIEGPVLTMHLFWYCPKTSLSSSDIYFRIGDPLTDQSLGHDYHKCESGDYFGSVSSLTPDKLWSGYNDGTCTKLVFTSTKISFSRQVYTYDEFDSLIYNETQICIQVGTKESCKTLKLENLYPIMDVSSAIIIFEPKLKTLCVFVLTFVIFMVSYD